jgi:putative restriction endonuclease
MDPSLTARLVTDHRRRLAWFEDHQGEVSPFPPKLEGRLDLATKAKGIYKAGGLNYAVSIRIKIASRYADGAAVPTEGGGWLLRYHQEGDGVADRDTEYANKGMMRCIEDRIPVGVLRELEHPPHTSRYQVMGLALPVRWSEGYFFLESIDPPTTLASDVVSEVLEATARTELDEAPVTIPDDDYDARLRIYRQIVARQGQPAFRAALMDAYRGRCAVTGCDVPAALEAAHLRPYRGPESNAAINGLLLRADIHTLLDLRLLALDPTSRRVILSKQLAGTHYEALSGRVIADPAERSQRPSQDALERAWLNFLESEELA